MTEKSASSSEESSPSSEPDSPSSVSVVLAVAAPDAPEPGWLARMLERVVDLLGLGRIDLSLIVVDDARMSELHERFSGVPGSTDVLTFDLGDEPPTEPIEDAEALSRAVVEGEVYACLDEARRRATEMGHDVGREVLLYGVHGLLHLLGYDDHTEEGHRRMHAKEDALLEAVGVGAVFALEKRETGEACGGGERSGVEAAGEREFDSGEA